MRILYFDYDDIGNPYAAGGQAYATTKLLSEIDDSYQITVVTGNYPNAKNKKFKGHNYIRLGLGNLGFSISLLTHWFLIPLYALRNQHRYDLIVDCFTGPFTVSLLPLVCKKPLVAIASFYGSDMLAKKYHLPISFFKNRLIKKYQNLITLTSEMASKIKSANPQANIKIIPGGVNNDLIEASPSNGDYVLYLGRIDIYNKGLDILVNAWRNIDFNLVIAGNGRKSDIEKLLKLIASLNLESRIKVIDRVEGEEKLKIVLNAKFIVQPTLFETFGYVALESLAAGKVLVCFDIEGYKWIPEEYAIKVKEISAESLKKALTSTLSNNVLIDIANVKNKEFARNFNWTMLVRKYEDFFKEIHEQYL